MNKPIIILIRNAQSFDFGGGERFPVLVSRVIQDRYMPIIVSRSPKLLTYAKDSGIRTIRGLWWSHQQWSGAWLLLFPLYIGWQIILVLWYLSVFISKKPRAVHIQSKDDFIGATLAAKMLNITVIWTDHADLKHIWRNIRVWYKNPIGKLVYLAAHLTHTITVISKNEYREVSHHLPARSAVLSRIRLVHNGTVDMFDHYPNRLGDTFTFCSTNRLVTDKGLNEMITAFKRFHAAHPDSRLILVGNGPEEDTFRELASDTLSIEFVGYQSDPLTFVATAHVLLQPTYHEGFSISILEGFMMEKPVIATNVGGNVEMIEDGKNGLLIPAQDTESLYLAMERLYSSPALRKKLASNARKIFVKNYVFDTIITSNFIPLYEAGHSNED